MRTPASRFHPGALFHGTYRVERVVAEGGAGVVLAATHVAHGRRVAVKVLRRDRLTPEIEARFAHEARVAETLDGEHVARVTDSGYAETGEPFLVTDLLDGHDIAAELTIRHALPTAEAVDVVVEACAGVAQAHARAIVHGALKPRNLFLVSRTQRVVVLDFGLTRVSGGRGQVDLSITASSFDTPRYMAPEQLRAGKPLGARADQHALAAILHELITGAPPFRADSDVELAVAIAVAPPPRLRDGCGMGQSAPRALEDALCRALGKRPEDRFPDLLGFAAAIAPSGGPRARAALERVREALGTKGSSPVRSRPLHAVASVASAAYKLAGVFRSSVTLTRPRPR